MGERASYHALLFSRQETFTAWGHRSSPSWSFARTSQRQVQLSGGRTEPKEASEHHVSPMAESWIPLLMLNYD